MKGLERVGEDTKTLSAHEHENRDFILLQTLHLANHPVFKTITPPKTHLITFNEIDYLQ